MGQLGDLSPEGSVVLGVFVGLISTSVQSLGLTLQRKSHILEDEKDIQDVRRPPYRRRRWQLGMFMFIIANLVGSTIQITTLPLPVLSTLQASGLVFNSICATLILGEAFTRYSFAGTLLVCGGAILIAIFGAIPEPAHNLDQLLLLLGRQQFILWMVGQLVLVLAIIVFAKLLKVFNPHTVNSPTMRLTRGMAYGSLSGILSAHSLLVAKSAVELLVRTLVDHVNQFNRWQSWMILLGLIALALSQLYYLHRGLKLCSTSILYPFVFCIYNIIAILDGLIYFRQTSRLSVRDALLISLGTIILLAGVLCLSWRLNPPSTSVQTPLTPGMGFLPTSPDSCSSSDHEDSPAQDSASAPLLPRRSVTLPSINTESGKRASFASYGALPLARSSRRVRYASNPLPPRERDHTPLSARDTRRLLRRRTIAEADEIWEELEEGADRRSPLASPYSTGGIRRGSTVIRSPFSARIAQRPRSAGASGFFDEHAIEKGAEEDGSATEAATQRTDGPIDDTHGPTSGDTTLANEDDGADIETGLLLRSDTGRTYIDQRNSRYRRRRSTLPAALDTQGATGGWWRMGTVRRLFSGQGVSPGGANRKGKGRTADRNGDGSENG